MQTEAYRKLSRVSFHDGQPIGIAWDGWTLVLDYKDWQEQLLRFKFHGVAFVSGFGGGASLCHAAISCDSPEIEKVKKSLSQDWGTGKMWRTKDLTQLVISDDMPLLNVIFHDVDIEHLKDDSATITAKFPEFGNSDGQ